MTSVSELDALVIGAGFAGLATAARLRQLGVARFALLEQGADVGEFWRTNYDRIQLHSPFHDLPDDGGERAKYGVFLKRDDLVAYFEAYARRHALAAHARFGQRVTRIARDGDGWLVESTRGSYRARTLAVATAGNRRPVVPALGGEASYRGELLHSKRYRNATPFAGKRVLVVGSGNSAAEIALDLARGGAAHVAMWVRAPRYVIRLSRMAKLARLARFLRAAFTPEQLVATHRIGRTHPDFGAEIAKKDAIFQLCMLDLSRFGVQRPTRGPSEEMYRYGRIPWFDVGTAGAIAARRIAVIDGNERPIRTLTDDGVQLGERCERFDAVILGTGFEPGLEEFIDDAQRLLAVRPETGLLFPITDGRGTSSVEPSLFFPGFDLNGNGGLSLGLWGFEVAERMAEVLGAKRA